MRNCAKLLLLGLLPLVSHGATVLLSSPSELSAADSVLTYSQPEGALVGSPVPLAAGSIRLTDGGSFQRVNQGSSFFGSFAPGTALLYNLGNGPVQVQFNAPVSEFGLSLQSNSIDFSSASTFTLIVQTSAGQSTYARDEGLDLLFLGVRGTAGDSIRSFTIASTDNNFVLGPISAGSAVPEPNSLFAVSVGLALLVGVVARIRYQRNPA